MALKRLTLTPADRQIIRDLISRPGGKANVETARKVREVRRRFDVRQFEKQLEKLSLRLQEFGIFLPNWDNLMNGAEATAEIAELLAAEEVQEEKEKLEKVARRVAAFAEPREFTIDEIYLDWVQELLQARDWSRVQKAQEDGPIKEIEIEVHPSHMEAIAELADTLRDAVAADSIQDEKESRKAKEGAD